MTINSRAGLSRKFTSCQLCLVQMEKNIFRTIRILLRDTEFDHRRPRHGSVEEKAPRTSESLTTTSQCGALASGRMRRKKWRWGDAALAREREACTRHYACMTHAQQQRLLRRIYHFGGTSERADGADYEGKLTPRPGGTPRTRAAVQPR